MVGAYIPIYRYENGMQRDYLLIYTMLLWFDL